MAIHHAHKGPSCPLHFFLRRRGLFVVWERDRALIYDGADTGRYLGRYQPGARLLTFPGGKRSQKIERWHDIVRLCKNPPSLSGKAS